MPSFPAGRWAIVVDSKVSLTAYERSIGTDDEDLKKQALKEHLQSLKSMWMNCRRTTPRLSRSMLLTCSSLVPSNLPLESTYQDPDLYQYAFERKIVLVTSSTLMATIKTVANLWKLEKQNKHAHDIARRAKHFTINLWVFSLVSRILARHLVKPQMPTKKHSVSYPQARAILSDRWKSSKRWVSVRKRNYPKVSAANSMQIRKN